MRVLSERLPVLTKSELLAEKFDDLQMYAVKIGNLKDASRIKIVNRVVQYAAGEYLMLISPHIVVLGDSYSAEHHGYKVDSKVYKYDKVGIFKYPAGAATLKEFHTLSKILFSDYLKG